MGPGTLPGPGTPPQQTATVADGTHPTGMHSCSIKCSRFRMSFDFFVNNQQLKNYISVNTYLAYLKLQLSQNIEERNS